MELELRTVLLIIGLVVIAAILIHGLISIRKSNKPVDLTGIDLREQDDEGNILRDGSGFDRHGVGVAKVIDDENDTQDEQSAVTTKIEELDLAGKRQPELELPQVSALDSGETTINFDVALEQDDPSAPAEILVIDEPVVPVFDSPIARKKPLSNLDFTKTVPPAKIKQTVQQVETQAEETAVIEQINLEQAREEIAQVEAEILQRQTEASAHPAPASKEPVANITEPMDVLVLNVVARDDNELEGAKLLPILLTLGFKFGEMDIFHRHASSAGHGEVLFSLANMVQPGTFDIDNMEQFSTTGVSLFMQLPHVQGNLETFNVMLNAAAKIAEEFDGQVLDGKRNILTNQLTHQYVERIRRVEQRVAANK